MSEVRTFPVPDGLDGMRVDAGVSRLLGISRTAVAELAGEGKVLIDGRTVGKSDRLTGTSWIEVEMPAPRPDSSLPIRSNTSTRHPAQCSSNPVSRPPIEPPTMMALRLPACVSPAIAASLSYQLITG